MDMAVNPIVVREAENWLILRKRILTQAIQFREKLSFDFRVMLTNAENVSMAGDLMWKLIRNLEPEVIVGPGFGATPLLYATASAALADGINLQVLMVRDQRKTYNQKKWVEGNRSESKGKRAVLVDDFMEGGSALGLVKKALKADNVEVDLMAVGVFFDMWSPLGSRQLSVGTLPVRSIFTRHDIGLSRDCFDARPPSMKGSSPPFVYETPAWWRDGFNRSRTYPTKCAPTVEGECVYVADENSTLWCHDLHTGDIRWSVASLEQPRKAIVQQLQFVCGSVVYGCYDGTLTRVDAENGDLMWRWKLDSSIHATPSVDEAGGRIFINTEQWNEGRPMGHVQCVDLKTGRLLWKHPHAWWPPGSTVYCASGDVVVAPCNDQSLTAWDATTGQYKWRFATKGLVRGRPVVSNGRVWAATEQGRVHCLEVETGRLVWTRRYGEGLHHQFLVVSHGCVMVLDGKWHLMGLGVEDGELRWITRLRSPGVWGPVICGDHAVVLSRQGHLAVFDLVNERKVWEGQIPGSYSQPPAISVNSTGGKLVAASNTVGLLTFDIHSHYLPKADSFEVNYVSP